ncbi:hypothetical protein TRFO_23720 [Tritrichomonas foetus]|uniref:Uncharacterized protein n=1 Tax=Tritrichomonas foetus TaxID=1144522 RepID=A0A1J4K9G2_9EUKA|nr:hypothetical protein TRFO_23720 [Tritrichomonas foetus]|eukprot:OHT07867.1 hypothetical protein TRFO_23720 [Tritrichomonas foetus]
MNFFFGKKEAQLDLQATIDSINDSPTADLYSHLLEFIPENSKIILENLLNNMVSTLIRPMTDQSIQKAIIEALHKMIYETELNNPDSPIYDVLKEHVNLPNALMMHVYPIDERVIFIIDKLFIKYPNIFLDYILEHPYCAEKMIQLVAATKNLQAASLFQRISVSRPEVLEKLKPMISKRIKEFPVSITVDFMIASVDLQNIIPKEEIESWLLTHDKFTISDVQSLLKFYPGLWNTETCLVILSRTDPCSSTKHIQWMHDMPQQEIKLKPSSSRNIASSLSDPQSFTIKVEKNQNHNLSQNQVSEEKGDKMDVEILKVEESGNEETIYDACESYAYVRLFALSFANPFDLDVNVIDEILDLCTNRHDYISAAAIQTVIIWILNYQLKIKSSLVYKSAGAIFEEERPFELQCLYRAFLRVLGTQIDNAVSIITAEPSLSYKENFSQRILDAKWTFPHFSVYLEKIPALKLVDFSESMAVLGYIVQFLGLAEGAVEAI